MSEDQEQQQQQQQQQQQDTPSASTKKGRGGNKQTAWSKIEDRQLCRSWIGVLREEEERGPNNSSTDTMWEGIYQHFTTHMKQMNATPKVERSCQALKNRWGLICRAVTIFMECYEEALQKYRNSWVNEDLLEEEAEALYIKKSDVNDKGKNSIDFNFTHCWKILRNSEKWKSVYNIEEPGEVDGVGGSRALNTSSAGTNNYISNSNSNSSSSSSSSNRPDKIGSYATAISTATMQAEPFDVQKRKLDLYVDNLAKRQRADTEAWKRFEKQLSLSNVLNEARNELKIMSVLWEQFPENDPRRLYFQTQQKKIIDKKLASPNSRTRTTRERDDDISAQPIPGSSINNNKKFELDTSSPE